MFSNLSRAQKILLGAGAGAVAVALIAVVLTSVAGDDTVLVVCSEATGGESVADELAELSGLDR